MEDKYGAMTLLATEAERWVQFGGFPLLARADDCVKRVFLNPGTSYSEVSA
jgi:hypothetical protein